MLKLKKEKQQEIYQYVIKRFNRLKQMRDVYDAKVKSWVFTFNSLPDLTEDVLSKIVVPYIWTQANTIKPRIAASIFNTKEFIDVSSHVQEYQDSEKKIRDYLLYKLDEHDFREKTRIGINLALIYPCAWEKVNLTANNDVTIANLDFFDVWCPYTWQNGKGDIIHRIETNMHNLKYYEKRGIYENVDEVSESNIDTEIPQLQAEIISYFLGISKQVVLDDVAYTEKGALGKVELLEWWGKYDIYDEGMLKDIIVTIANRQIGIRIDENVYEGQQPFFPIRIIRNQCIVYGKPVAQVLESSQEELNTIRRQRIDYNNLILKPPLKYNRLADIDWENFFVAPDKFWPVDDPNDIMPMQFPIPPQTSYMEENMLKQDAQQAIGGTDTLQGMSPPGRQTATGLSILTTEGATRMKDYVYDVAEDKTKEIRFMVYLLRKFKKDSVIIKRLNSQEWEKLTADELSGNYAVDIQITNIQTNKELRLQLLLNLLTILERIPGVNTLEFVKRILDAAEIKNTESIIPQVKQEIEKNLVTQRDLEAETKRQKKLTEGINRPESNILKPLAPSAPTVIQNPLLDVIKNMGGQS